MINVRLYDFVVPLRSKKANLILLGDVVGKLRSLADFKLRVTVIVECECAKPNLQFDVAFEKMRIVPQNLPLVAAL